MPSAGSFREEVENVKIRFLSHNFFAKIGDANRIMAKSMKMMNICPKYGFDILIISGIVDMTYNLRQTTPRVWHKVPTDELKKLYIRARL